MWNDAWAEIPFCDWVYFATPARASNTITAEFVMEARAIVRTVFNTKGIRIPNVSLIKPGDKILLAYGGHGQPYHPVFRCTVETPEVPILLPRNRYQVFKYLDGTFDDRLRAWSYEPDPILLRFTGIAIKEIQDLRHVICTIPHPIRSCTLRRWKEVFLRGES